MQNKRVNSSKDDLVFDGVVYMISLFALTVVAYPLMYIVVASFSDPIAVVTGRVVIFPIGFTLNGYSHILRYRPIWIGYRNTIFYTSAGTLINLIVTLPAAYSLSRKDLVGRHIATLVITFTMFFSGGIIPTYLVVRQLNLLNTVWALLLPVAASAWNIIIARTYYQSSIPFELQEAAYIDGCSTLKLFSSIIIPLSKPIIAVLALFYAVSHWNSFFNALLYLSNVQLFPLQIFLRNILILDQMEEMLAGADMDTIKYWLLRQQLREVMKFGIIVVSSLPVIILYPFLQKYFVKGVMIGAIKG
jgi:putative aldouronate transport system permease protein